MPDPPETPDPPDMPDPPDNAGEINPTLVLPDLSNLEEYEDDMPIYQNRYVDLLSGEKLSHPTAAARAFTLVEQVSSLLASGAVHPAGGRFRVEHTVNAAWPANGFRALGIKLPAVRPEKENRRVYHVTAVNASDLTNPLRAYIIAGLLDPDAAYTDAGVAVDRISYIAPLSTRFSGLVAEPMPVASNETDPFYLGILVAPTSDAAAGAIIGLRMSFSVDNLENGARLSDGRIQ